MKINHKYIANIAKVGIVALVAGNTLTSCEEDKLLTTDFEEVTIPTDVIMDVTETLPIGVGMDTTISYTVLPLDFPDRSVRFISSNESVATVDANGTIHGVSVGEATITCTLPIGFGPNSTVVVNVISEVIKAQSLNLYVATSLGEEGKIYVTDEIQLAAEILPANHTYDRLVWKSSNENIATIDDKGLMKCLAEGNVTITATTTDRSGVSGSINLAVDKYVAVESVSIADPDAPICIVGGDYELDVTYFPANATKGSVEWSSADESIATVHRGIVTPTGFGSTVITATCTATGEQASVNIEIPEGWYVWDASNSFMGLNKATSWISNNENPTIENGVWRVYFPDAGTGKWRRDIKLNCSNSDMLPIHSSRPVMALRCTIPRGGNNTWDVRDSGNPKCNDGVDLPDGTRLIYIDLTSKFEGWGVGIHEFNLFQLKVADIPNENVDKNAAYYDVYWARTFATVDEATTFAIQDAEANPKN